MTPAARRKRVASVARRITGVAFLVTMFAACRVGGPEAPSPIADGGAGGKAGRAGADTGVPPHTVADVATAAPEVAASVDLVPGTPADTASATDGKASCAPPFKVEVCEPVCNTGCPALLRCDVSDVPQTGKCVGIWIGQEGDACFKGDSTDACAAGLTCLEGKCARLCYRDSDCSRPGTCCTRELTGPAGKTGFRTCATCPM